MTSSKREEYLMLVQVGTQALLNNALQARDGHPRAQASVMSRYLAFLSEAIGAADKIPADKSALDASLDVIDYLFNALHGDDKEPDRTWLVSFEPKCRREHRTAWANFINRSDLISLMANAGPVEMRVRGKWVAKETEQDRPAPEQDAPTDTRTATERYQERRRVEKAERLNSLHLTPDAGKILKALRRLDAAQVKALNTLVPHLDRLAVLRLLKRLRAAGWVETVGQGGGAAWKIKETAPPE